MYIENFNMRARVTLHESHITNYIFQYTVIHYHWERGNYRMKLPSMHVLANKVPLPITLQIGYNKIPPWRLLPICGCQVKLL